MVDIAINAAEQRRAFLDDAGMTPGDYFYVLQYDLPGVDLPDVQSTGKHHHLIPVDALANFMLDTASIDGLGALEYCVLDRVQNIYAEVDGSAPMSDAIISRGAALQNARSTMQATLVEEAYNMPLVGSDTEMLDHLYGIAAPDSGQVAVRLSAQEAAFSTITGVQIDKASRGWSTVSTLVMNDQTKIRQAQRKMFDVRYGHALHDVISERMYGDNNG